MVLASVEKSLVDLTAWTTLILIICGYLGGCIMSLRKQTMSIPVINCLSLASNKEKLQKCFEKHAKKNEIYKLRMAHHDMIMLPPKLMLEIKSLPEDQVSFAQELAAMLNGKYTGVDGVAETFVRTVSRDLTRHTGSVIAEMIDECEEYAISHELGAPTEWTALPALAKCVRIIALVSGRIFIGLPSSRDERWVRLIINHASQTIQTGINLWMYPKWLRGIVAPLTRGVRELKANRKLTESIIRPLIQERVKLLQNLKPGESPPDDVLQWLINNDPGHAFDVAFQAKQQLDLGLASIHTTGMLLTQNLFDLAAYSEYQQILREEVLEVLKEENFVIRKQSLTKLKKLDSFIRESQRFAPPSLVGVNRLVTAPNGITLSNGFHLPHKSFIATPSGQVAMDHELWDNPEEFDGLRFYKLRQIPGNQNKYQLVTANLEHIIFGQGTHTCPGRFFASNEIKLLLMHILLNYDMKLENGKSRPPNRYFSISVSPDPTAKIMFRKRQNGVKLVAAEGPISRT